MIIALDYDSTYTEDEHLWREVVELIKKRGHSVSFVTFRRTEEDNQDILADAELLDIKVVFCNHKQKASVFAADIWIDDSPRYIPTALEIGQHWNEWDLKDQLPAKLKITDKRGN